MWEKKKSVIIIVICCGLLLGGLLWLTTLGSVRQTLGMEPKDHQCCVVLDAGHGGADGGAVAKDGATEKELNLAIAQQVRHFLQVAGVQVIMVRDGDGDLHDSDARTLADQKKSDLRNRVKLAGQHPDALFLSIHMNAFPDGSQHGAQVFYKRGEEESKAWADLVQGSLLEVLEDGNKRQAKEISDGVYLMKKIENQGVLVECGFLSNWEEAQKLQQEDYQKDVAFAIVMGTLRYLQQHCPV